MKATNLAPFLMKTPAHIPHTLPKVNSYRFREDAGSGGRSESFGADGGVAITGGVCCEVGSEDMLTRALDQSEIHSILSQ